MKKVLKDKVEIISIDEKEIQSFPNSNKNNFGVILTDPILLDPEIDNKKLKEREIYEIYNDFSRYDGTHKGQLVLGLIFHSMEEMYQIYIELIRLGYKTKVYEEKRNSLYKKSYNLNDLNNFIYFSGSGNIITTQVIDLDKYKKDLLEIGEKLGYRFMWETDLEKNKRIRNLTNKIIVR